jgi:hypothetical protein
MVISGRRQFRLCAGEASQKGESSAAERSERVGDGGGVHSGIAAAAAPPLGERKYALSVVSARMRSLRSDASPVVGSPCKASSYYKWPFRRMSPFELQSLGSRRLSSVD